MGTSVSPCATALFNEQVSCIYGLGVGEFLEVSGTTTVSGTTDLAGGLLGTSTQPTFNLLLRSKYLHVSATQQPPGCISSHLPSGRVSPRRPRDGIVWWHAEMSPARRSECSLCGTALPSNTSMHHTGHSSMLRTAAQQHLHHAQVAIQLCNVQRRRVVLCSASLYERPP